MSDLNCCPITSTPSIQNVQDMNRVLSQAVTALNITIREEESRLGFDCYLRDDRRDLLEARNLLKMPNCLSHEQRQHIYWQLIVSYVHLKNRWRKVRRVAIENERQGDSWIGFSCAAEAFNRFRNAHRINYAAGYIW